MNTQQAAEMLLQRYADAPYLVIEMDKKLKELGYDRATRTEDVAYSGTTPKYVLREGSAGNFTSDPTAQKAQELLSNSREQRIHDLLVAIESLTVLQETVDRTMFALKSSDVEILRMKYQDNKTNSYIMDKLKIKAKSSYFWKINSALKAFYDAYMKGV